MLAVTPATALTEREAAAYLAMSSHTLRAWRARGGGPAFHKLGRSVRYRVADLDRWLESCRVPQGRSQRRAGAA
jgi:excisionase family DNA binding protein